VVRCASRHCRRPPRLRCGRAMHAPDRWRPGTSSRASSAVTLVPRGPRAGCTMRKNEELRQRISERELKKRESCACSIYEREKEEIRTRAAAEGKNKREAKNKVRCRLVHQDCACCCFAFHLWPRAQVPCFAFEFFQVAPSCG
jgi:hypothetical protein